MPCDHFVQMLTAFSIVPIFIKITEVRSIFGETKSDAGDDADGLNETAFFEALSRVAVFALSQPNSQFPKLYPRVEDKVRVLLELWGLGDPEKLSLVQQHHDGHDVSTAQERISSLGL
tara:strand:- start:153 stop:506 length:354 start_codon:yes stop_codon:yes gene_type:complete